MNKSVIIYYFSGTGNSKKLSEVAGDEFRKKGFNVIIKSIDDKNIDNNHDTFDLYGIICPVYALGLPKIVEKFLRIWPNLYKKQAFIIVNYGSYGTKRILEGYEGNAIYQAKGILYKKGYQVIGTLAVPMPLNTVIAANTPKPEANVAIINKAKKIIIEFIDGIVKGKSKFKKTFLIFRPLWWLVNKLFIINTWYTGKFFKVNKKCIGCGICSRICPVKNIKMVGKRPVWGLRCESCLRCINLCPNSAIQGLFGTTNRRRYKEVDYNISELIK